jgi:3-oxoacyl-[acyl-carrier-protein] synthase II
MARFAQYALAASEEALEDAGWKPTGQDELESTVSLPHCSLE